MRRFFRVFLLSVLSVLTLTSIGFASDNSAGVKIRHFLFYSQKEILVRERYPATPAPYPSYQQKEYEYYACCAVEAENPADTDIEDLAVICQFRDKFGRVLRTDRAKLKIKAKNKVRLIFRSGLMNTSLTGAQTTGSALNNYLIMSPEHENSFINFGFAPDFSKNSVLSGIFNLTLTELSCRFQLEQKGKTSEYKAK